MGNEETATNPTAKVSEGASKINPGHALLGGLLDSARKHDASAIHFYTTEKSNSCLYEVAGNLQPCGKKLNDRLISELIEYIKASANFETSDLALIQTAQIELDAEGRLTASLISNAEFRRMHLTIYLQSSNRPRQLEDLGFWGRSLELFEFALDHKQGIILVDSTDPYALRSIVNSSLAYLNQHQKVTSVSFDSSLLPSIEMANHDRVYTSLSPDSISLAKKVLATMPAVTFFLDPLNSTTLEIATKQVERGGLVFATSSCGSAAKALNNTLSISQDILAKLTLVVSASPIQTIVSSNGSHPLSSEIIAQMESFFEIDLPITWRSIYSRAGIKSPEKLLHLDFPVASEYGGVSNLIEVFKPTEDIKRILSRNRHLSSSTLNSIAIRSGMATQKEDGLIKALRKEVDLADVIELCK